MALKLAEQVAVMFILLGVGIFIRKRGIVSEVSAGQFSGFVLLIVTPTLLIQSFQRDFEPELGLLIAATALLAAVFHLLSIPVCSGECAMIMILWAGCPQSVQIAVLWEFR